MSGESGSHGLGQGQRYLTLGFKFAGGIVFFVLLGLWLDRRLGTTPVFVVTGTLVGSALSFFSVWIDLNRGDGEGRG